MIRDKVSYFSSNSSWIKNREKTFFKSLEDVDRYQKNRLSYILYVHDIKRKEELSHHTNVFPLKKNVKNIKLLRSGTTSITSDRGYHYSQPEQEIIDRHHIWKIQKSHQITQPGNVVWISLSPRMGPDKKFKLIGPKKYENVGYENDVYELFFDQSFNKKEWQLSLELLDNIDIKFIRASPSIIETIYYFLGDSVKFNCSLMSSEETLNSQVKKIAESMFNKVIDKMVCWDGCLGWFECPYKIKHIYDELCVVQQLENDILSVTDLNNLACPFINYINGDRGKIGQIECDCGISGNYFKFFEGKIIESIYVNEEGKEKYIPGRLISEKLSGFFRLGKNYDIKGIDFDKNFTYRIRQRIDLEIDFYYDSDNDLTHDQKERIISFCNFIIWGDKDCKKINIIKTPIGDLISKEHRRSKSLSVESDFLRNNRSPNYNK
jgi:hypothetical protein